MAIWTQLSTRINTTPLVICGPILRNTTVSEVSVWITLRAPANLKLKIYDHLAANPNNALATSPSWVPATQFGANLYTCVITLTGLSLSPSKTYSYDIDFDPKSGHDYTNAGLSGFTLTQTLSSNDILSYGANGIDKITFLNSGISRPSFSLPPNDINKLRIVYSSCRKPHGPAEDALEGLHDMIRDSLVNSSNSPISNSYDLRPHQVFMTGDQIYTDDVADCLLRLIVDASSVLMGWTENLPIPSPNNTAALREVGSRAKVSLENVKFTAEGNTMKSHLWTLGEFYGMYLFAWSPELWDNFSAASQPPDYLIPDFYTTYNRGVSVNSEYEAFKAEVNDINNFRKKLDNVRRALANVPIYMVMDDHDVTDDWNRSKEWFDNTHTLSNLLGRQIISNAMVAYCVFQDWGNRSSYYNSGPGAGLLVEAEYQAPVPPQTFSLNYTNIGDLVLPIYNAGLKHLEHNVNGISWHYKVNANPATGYEVIVLDCRTLRGFPGGGTEPPEVISTLHIPAQIPLIGLSTKLTILISPGPIFGCPYVEFGKEVGDYRYSKDDMDIEDWGFQKYATSVLLSKLAERRTIYNPLSQQNEGRVLLLSGDVHYALTSRVQFWGKVLIGAIPGPYNLVMAHLTASASKNEKGSSTGSLTLHDNGYVQNLFFLSSAGYCLPDDIEVTGYEVLTLPTPRNIGTSQRNMVSIPILATDALTIVKPKKYPPSVSGNGVNATNSLVNADWSYRVRFLMDKSGILNRGGAGPSGATMSLGNGPIPLADYNFFQTDYIKYSDEWGPGKEIVGRNNIGEVKFVWPAPAVWPAVSSPDIKHSLWWRIKGGYTLYTSALPYTEHTVSLPFNDVAFPKP